MAVTAINSRKKTSILVLEKFHYHQVHCKSGKFIAMKRINHSMIKIEFHEQRGALRDFFFDHFSDGTERKGKLKSRFFSVVFSQLPSTCVDLMQLALTASIILWVARPSVLNISELCKRPLTHWITAKNQLHGLINLLFTFRACLYCA